MLGFNNTKKNDNFAAVVAKDMVIEQPLTSHKYNGEVVYLSEADRITLLPSGEDITAEITAKEYGNAIEHHTIIELKNYPFSTDVTERIIYKFPENAIVCINNVGIHFAACNINGSDDALHIVMLPVLGLGDNVSTLLSSISSSAFGRKGDGSVNVVQQFTDPDDFESSDFATSFSVPQNCHILHLDNENKNISINVSGQNGLTLLTGTIYINWILLNAFTEQFHLGEEE